MIIDLLNSAYKSLENEKENEIFDFFSFCIAVAIIIFYYVFKKNPEIYKKFVKCLSLYNFCNYILCDNSVLLANRWKFDAQRKITNPTFSNSFTNISAVSNSTFSVIIKSATFYEHLKSVFKV